MCMYVHYVYRYVWTHDEPSRLTFAQEISCELEIEKVPSIRSQSYAVACLALALQITRSSSRISCFVCVVAL